MDDFIEGDDTDVRVVDTAAEIADHAERVLRRRKEAYACWMAGTASKDDIAIVTTDLMKFCRVFETTERDPGWDMKILEGRRQVMLRIMEFSKLPVDQLFRRYHEGR
jgi:hypothetical protein